LVQRHNPVHHGAGRETFLQNAPRILLRSNNPVSPLTLRQERNLADLYRMWPLRISFPNSPANVDGMDNDLVLRLDLTSINSIAQEVISDLKNKEERGEV